MSAKDEDARAGLWLVVVVLISFLLATSADSCLMRKSLRELRGRVNSLEGNR